MNRNDNSKTILIVEDEAIISIITAKTLGKFGYDVVSVNSGEKAVEKVSQCSNISLVLMDIDLGDGIDGTEAARRILDLRDIPVVFHTAHSERDMVEKVKGITRYGYVIKSSGDFVLNSSIEMAFELFDANRNIEESLSALRDSEEKYRAAFMTSPDAVNINTIEGRYVDINEGFTRLTGFTRDDVIGVLSSEIDIWTIPGDRARLMEDLKNSGYVENLESVFRFKDGTLTTGLMSARIINIKNEPHILSITKDISHRKQFEKEINIKNDELRALNDELMATIEELEATNEEFEAINSELVATNEELVRRKEIIKEKQEFTDRILESLPGIFYVYSYPELRLKRWNRNHETLLGYGPGEIDDRYILEWHIPEAKDGLMNAVESVMKNGYGSFESPLKTKNGDLVPFLLTGVKFEERGLVYLMGVGIDVTELRLVEQEKSKFLDIIERSLNEIYIFDSVTLRFQYVNRGALENLGYNMGEMLSLTPVDIRTDYNETRFRELVQPLLSGEKERLVFHAVHERKNGSRYPVEVFLQLIDTGREKLFLAVINDITERKKIEEALSESEERYRTLARILPDGIVIHSDGIIVYANEAAHKIVHAASSDQLIGMPVIGFVHPDYREMVSRRIRNGILGQLSGEPAEEIFITLDGASITVSVTAIPFTYSGNPAMLIIFNDITERKQADEKIKSLFAEKELLLREVHHRIKNNMNTIKGLLALHAFSLEDPSSVNALKDAENRLQSIMVLYDKLYRSDEFRELSLYEYLPPLVDEIAENFIIHDNVKIEKKIDDFTVDTKILFPLGIIVNEIITNAMKYAFTGRSSGAISISASEKNGRIVVVIADNGIGIPESVSIGNSTGFGLSLVSMLTEQIGGEMRIERENGTKFILEFIV